MDFTYDKKFLHIITNYSPQDWNVIKDRYLKEKGINLFDYQPVFLKTSDFAFPFQKQATLIINEWRKYKKIGVIQIKSLNEFELLEEEQSLWLKSNSVMLLKHPS